MKQISLEQLRQLKELVLQIAGISILSAGLCGHLAALISKNTGRQISETTIKRLYGFAESNFQPSNFTLSTLSMLCGYPDWMSWETRIHRPMFSKCKNQLECCDFNKLFYLNSYPMWIYDPDSLKFLEVNAAAIRSYGYSRKQFLAMTILDIRPNEEKERVLREVKRSDDPCYHDSTFRHLLKNGKIINVDIVTYKLRMPQGDMRLVMSVKRW